MWDFMKISRQFFPHTQTKGPYNMCVVELVFVGRRAEDHSSVKHDCAREEQGQSDTCA